MPVPPPAAGPLGCLTWNAGIFRADFDPVRSLTRNTPIAGALIFFDHLFLDGRYDDHRRPQLLDAILDAIFFFWTAQHVSLSLGRVLLFLLWGICT